MMSKILIPTLKQIEDMGYADVCDLALKLKGRDLRLFVNRFKRVCKKHGGYAYSNIGYVIGYYNDTKTRKKLYKIFQTSHPVFG
jgi:hypothetical protein